MDRVTMGFKVQNGMWWWWYTELVVVLAALNLSVRFRYVPDLHTYYLLYITTYTWYFHLYVHMII